MSTALMGFLAALGYTLLFVGGLHAVPRLGAAGRSLSRWMAVVRRPKPNGWQPWWRKPI